MLHPPPSPIRLPGRTLVAVVLSLAVVPCVGAQGPDSTVSAPVSDMHYDVRADRASLAMRHASHVTTTFDVAGGGAGGALAPCVDAGGVRDQQLRAIGLGLHRVAGGTPLRWDKLDYDTWRVRPTAAGRVTVQFDYEADSLDNAMSWTSRISRCSMARTCSFIPKGGPSIFPPR